MTANALEVAKRAVYRGAGLAVQLPWQLPVSKPILVVDLFGGFGGTPLALFSMGVHFILLSCDSDPVAAACLKANFPAAVHFSNVKKLTGRVFQKVLAKREFAAVLVGGGSPCQGNTSLNRHAKCLDDPRPQQPQHLAR